MTYGFLGSLFLFMVLVLLVSVWQDPDTVRMFRVKEFRQYWIMIGTLFSLSYLILAYYG